MTADQRRDRRARDTETTSTCGEEFLRKVWQSMESGILLVDADTRRIIDVNPFAAALIGAPRAEIVGRVCHPVVCPAKQRRCPILDLGRTVDRCERRLVRADGSVVPIIKSVTPIELGGRRVLLESFVDIGRLKEAEKALRVTQFVTDHAGESVYWMDPDARFLYVNDTACCSLGYSREELLSMTVHDIDPKFPREVWSQHWEELRNRGSMVVESVHRTKDGREFPVEISLSHQASEGEERNCAFARDITARKQAEARRALEARVLAILNRPNDWQHLFRDLLVSIKDFAQIDAAGIRIREGEDYPYYEWRGFSDEFVAQERQLCAYDRAGEVVRDGAGNPCLECMCGTVIQGRTDPTLPYFTETGSFWTNSTSGLLAATDFPQPGRRTRNRCSAAGYESVALIPLRAGDETIGLLQLNDHRCDRFTPDLIVFFEEIGHSIGIACTRRNTQKALRESERRLTTLMGNLPGMAYRCANAPDWPMEFVSEGGAVLTGYAPAELTAEEPPAYGDLIHPDDRQTVWDTVQDAVARGEPFVVEYRLQDRRGVERWVWEQGRVVGEDSAGTEILEGFISDITARRCAEEERLAMQQQLQQSQRLEALGTLASGVAHEINNPINGIMNYAELIRDGLGGDGSQTEFAGEIIKEGKRIAGLVKSLLQFARRERDGHGVARVHDIVETTSTLVRTVMRRDQVTLAIDVPGDLPEIRCSPQQVEQVLVNLITNARDALCDRYAGYHEDKIIRVSARAVALDPMADGDSDSVPEAVRAGLRLTVEDRGGGIPECVRERLFDPFYTTKPEGKGTGLGLSISHRIAVEHGGCLSVESKEGEWTRFHLDLPLMGDGDKSVGIRVGARPTGGPQAPAKEGGHRHVSHSRC